MRRINNERVRRTATMEHAGRETIVQEKLKTPSTIERRAQCALYRGGIKFRGVTTGLCVNLSLLCIGRCQTSYRDTHYVNYLRESLRFSIVLIIGDLNGVRYTRVSSLPNNPSKTVPTRMASPIVLVTADNSIVEKTLAARRNVSHSWHFALHSRFVSLWCGPLVIEFFFLLFISRFVKAALTNRKRVVVY